MALTLTIGDQAETISTGDLADAHALQASTFTLAANVFNTVILGSPISALAGDFLKGNLSAGQQLNWKQTIDAATSITFGVKPGVNFSVIVRKAGTVFPSSPPDIKGDPTSTKTITVPAGKGYVSIILSVSLEVTAQGKFTSGNFGVAAGINSDDSFTLANHFVFDQTTTVQAAILDAFGRFVLPFGPNISDFSGLHPGDIVESEFVGSLALSASMTEGFNGVLFGAFGNGGLSLSAKSPLGSVLAKAKPTFSLGLTLEVDYTHTDAFRMVIFAQPNQIELLFFKRRTDDLVTKIDASASVNPGVVVDFTNQLPGLINSAAQKLVAGADPNVAQDFAQGVSQLVSAASQPLSDATTELNSVVPNLMKKLPTLGLQASATFESVTENTIFGIFDFSLPLNPAAWKLAMSGDLQAAMHQHGVSLGAGSYVENSLRKSTTLSFAFFGLKAQTVQEYFKDVTLTYAGNGVFQYRLKTGIDATSDIFGHEKEADIYFLVDASLAVDGKVSNEDVELYIVRKDQNASDRSFGLGKTISLVLPWGGSAIAQLLNDATRNNPKVPVTLTAQFAASAFKNIQATPFIIGKPQPIEEQQVDKANFEAFIAAVDDVAASTDHQFPDGATFAVWVGAEQNVNDGPPNRRVSLLPLGITNPSQVYQGTAVTGLDDDTLRVITNFLEEARRGTNLFDDLHQLQTLPGDTDTSTQLADLVDTVTAIVKTDVPVFPLTFLNGLLLALVRRMQAVPTSVDAPASLDVKTFDVTISYA